MNKISFSTASAAWTLFAAVNLLAVIIWGSSLDWQLQSLSAYSIFPLLGLIAFSTMWSQYVAGAYRKLRGVSKAALLRFANITGGVATTAIILHPSLLVWQLWRDGAGLPPGSYAAYVAPAMQWAVALGTFSLLIFLAYELRHRYHDRHWWRYVDSANDAAMIAIYVHALSLGSHIQLSWFYPLWIFYGVVLAAALVYKYFGKPARPAPTGAANTKNPA